MVYFNRLYDRLRVYKKIPPFFIRTQYAKIYVIKPFTPIFRMVDDLRLVDEWANLSGNKLIIVSGKAHLGSGPKSKASLSSDGYTAQTADHLTVMTCSKEGFEGRSGTVHRLYPHKILKKVEVVKEKEWNEEETEAVKAAVEQANLGDFTPVS